MEKCVPVAETTTKESKNEFPGKIKESRKIERNYDQFFKSLQHISITFNYPVFVENFIILKYL